MSSNPVPAPFPVEEFAKAVVAQINARGGAPAVVRVRPPAEAPATQDNAPGTISGGVTIEIIYNNVTYLLKFNAPTAEFKAWLFLLSQATTVDNTGVEINIATFEFVDGQNWKVHGQNPVPIPIGDSFVIKTIALTFQNGTVPPIPPNQA